MAKKKKLAEQVRERLKSNSANLQPVSVSSNSNQLANRVRSNLQKQEQDRAMRMRQGLSTVVRSSFNRKISQPTTVQKGLYSNLRNALAPVKSTADYTRSQQSKYLTTDLQRKGMYNPAAQLMAGKTNIGVEQGKALRAGMPTNSNLIESWRATATDAEQDARQRYGYDKDFYQKQVTERLDNSGKKEVFDPSNGQITTPLPARFNTVAPNEVTYKAGDALRGMRWDDIRSGFADAWARKNVDDTYERQYGRTIDDDTQEKLEAQRGTLGYGTGMAAGQMTQYALTRGGLSALGMVGRGAKAADTAGKAFRAEMAIDQAASLPMNIIDAMKEDNAEGIIKRFGLNQGLDLIFGGITEGVSVKRNPLYKRAEELHTTAKNAIAEGDNAAGEALNQSSRRQLMGIPGEEWDRAKIEAVQNAEGTVGEFPSTDYAYRGDGGGAHYDNMRDDMLGAIESQEAIGAGEVPNNIGMRADITTQPTATPRTGIDKVLNDYNTDIDGLVARMEDPSFNDTEMLESVANDILPVGKRRGISIDAERKYSDILNGRENIPENAIPTRDEIYNNMLRDSVVDELRRSQTPRAADDVAQAIPQRQEVETVQNNAREAVARETAEQVETPTESTTWDGIENVAVKEEEPKDILRQKPNRKENQIPKPSEQRIKEQVFYRGGGETAGAKEAAEQVAQEAPKRRQVKGILKEGEPKTEYSDMSLHDLQAKRHSLEEQARYDNSGRIEDQIVDIDEEFKRRGKEPNWFSVEPEEGGKRVRSPKEANAEVERLKKKYGEFSNGLNKKIETDEGVRRNLKTLDTILPTSSPEVDHIVTNGMLDGKYAIDDGRTVKDILTEVKGKMAENPEAYTNKVVNFDEAVDARERIVALETAQAYWKEVGNTEYELKATEALAKIVPEAASMLKIHGILRRLSTPARMDYLDQTIAKLEKRFEKRLKRAKIEHIKVSEETRNMLKEAKTDKQTKEAWTRASLEIWNQIPASTKEKMDFIRVNAMLLNPKTHIRNILGNLVFLPMRELKNITGTGLEYIAMKAGVLDSSKRTKAIIPLKEGMDYARSILKDMGDELRGASRYFENIANDRPMDVDVFMAGRQKGNPFVNGIRKFTDKVGDANAWLLEHEDFVFFNGAFREQFGRVMKARKLTVKDLENNPALRNDVIEVATEEALRATYRDESAAARAISKWKNPGENARVTRKAVGVALDAILPFTKTPINILRRAVDYSPAGAGKGIYNLAKGIHTGNQKQVVKGLDQLASAIPGSGLAMLGWFMAERDGVTGNLGSDKDDQFMRDLGKQKFSIVFHSGTDKEWSYTLDWAAPGCIPFFTGVALKEMSDGGVNFWEAADAFEKMFEPMTEMSVMQGIKNTAETFQRESGGGVWQGLVSVGVNTGLQYAGQYKPTLVSQTARLVDPVRRDTTSTADTALQRQIERWANKQIAGIPGLSKTLNPYQNVWGEEEKNTYNDDIVMRIMENYFSPGYAKKYKADDVDKELLKEFEKSGDDSVLPSRYTKYSIAFDGGDVRFSPDDLNNFNKVRGNVSKKDLRQLFNTSEYKEASSVDRAKMIANVYADAKVEAKHDTLLKMGKDEWKVYTDEMSGKKKPDYSDAKASGLKAEQYYNYMKTKDWDLDDSGKPVKSELVMYLNKQDLTDEQRAVIFGKLSNANNPYEDGTAHTTDWQAEFDKYLEKKNGGSSKSKSKGRSGRRSSGGGKAKARAKTESEKKFSSLQKMQAPTTGKGIEALAKSASGLTKSQKKALLKLMQKKLEV